MQFKIKNENSKLTLFMFAAIGIMVVPMFLLEFEELTGLYLFFLAIGGLAIAVLTILIVAEAISGTYIIVEDDAVFIKSVTIRKKLAFEDISNIDIESYTRYRRKVARREFRMRMRISLSNGKVIVLNDNASAFNGATGFFLNKPEQMPDEEVPLYMAYTVIKPRI